MSEVGLWGTVVALAGVTGALLIGQARRRPAPERTGRRPVPTDRVWLRPGEVAHTIHPAGPEATIAAVLGPTTLLDLLFDRPSAAGRQIRAGLAGLDGLGPERLGAEGLDADRVADAISGLLDRPVTGLVLQAWDEQPSVQEACARTRNVPGATAFVVVTGHALHTRQRPRIHIAAVGRQEVDLEFVLTVALTIDAVTITVVEGRVTGCVAGTTASTVELGLVGPDGIVREIVRRDTHEPATAGRAQVATTAARS